jgi:hypothetical protein
MKKRISSPPCGGRPGGGVLWFCLAFLLPPAVSAAPLPVELYVMSLCPYGVQAENGLLPAARSLGPAVQVDIHFIAQESGDGFRALHGPPEVEENIRQLCALNRFPDKAFDYILERNKNYRSPDWRAAASTAAVDAAALSSCAEGPEGAALLKADIPHHQSRAARASPTIFIDGKPYQGPRGRKAFALALCDALKARGDTLPAACAEAAALPADVHSAPTGGCETDGGARSFPVQITAVTDSRCSFCGPALLDPMKQRYPKADLRVVPWDSREGRRLSSLAETKALPLYFLDAGVEKDPDFPGMKEAFFRKTGDRYWLVPGPRTYLPTVRGERRRRPRRLDAFLPPSSWAVMSDLLTAAGPKSRSTLHLHPFLGEKPTAEETEEARRLSCLFQKTTRAEALVYVECRRQHPADPSVCSLEKKIVRCVENSTGESLLKNDLSLAHQLGITVAPSLLWENRYGPFPWDQVDWRAFFSSR